MSRGSQVQMMTSADGLLGTPRSKIHEAGGDQSTVGSACGAPK
jgi:hypothetical protein